MQPDLRPPFRGLSYHQLPALLENLPTPCYLLDERRLVENGELLAGLQERTGCQILLAQKAFANFGLYPLLAPYLAGTEASGLFEARLGSEEMPGKEVHVFCAAYREEEMGELLNYADHIVFNSLNQLRRWGPLAKEAGKSLGLRLNPEFSTQEGHAIYDPCGEGSRLGVTLASWEAEGGPELLPLLEGFHFHTLCEQDSPDLERTLAAFLEKFGPFLPSLRWLNLGGGHHITRLNYDLPRLERILEGLKERYPALTIYLEPGEAWALEAGYLVTRVLDLTRNGSVHNAILDASAACHMPDVLEMPYRPPLYAAGEAQEKAYTYRLGGPTCLAGDIIGDYSFERPLKVGQPLIFGDMAIYTTCKNNTFNGMPLPSIILLRRDGQLQTLRSFGYEDFKGRLG